MGIKLKQTDTEIILNFIVKTHIKFNVLASFSSYETLINTYSSWKAPEGKEILCMSSMNHIPDFVTFQNQTMLNQLQPFAHEPLPLFN